MPETLDDTVDRVTALLSRGQATQADVILRLYIARTATSTLRDEEPAIRALIARFFRKRQRDLGLVLDERLVAPPAAHPRPTERQRVPLLGTSRPTASLEPFDDDIKRSFGILADQFIYQWSTRYRTLFEDIFSGLMLFGPDASGEAHLKAVRLVIATHTQAIFSRGFEFQVKRSSQVAASAVEKNVRGHLSLLKLSTDAYGAQVDDRLDRPRAQWLRRICSQLLAGTIEGFVRARFGTESGRSTLGGDLRWLEVTPLMNFEDVAAVANDLADGPSRQVLVGTLVPFARAFDEIFKEVAQKDDFILPKVITRNPFYDRLEVSLAIPGKTRTKVFVEVDLYLSPAPLVAAAIAGSVKRGADLVVAPLVPGAFDAIQAGGGGGRVVDTRLGLSEGAARLREALRQAVAPYSLTLNTARPFTENAAERFPLEGFTRTFLVQRPRMKALFGALEAETGVHVWCSVRRSGKTVACGSFARVSENSALALQTAIRTESSEYDEVPDETSLREAVRAAIKANAAIPDDFFDSHVRMCANQDVDSRRKLVLFLDEYEELFRIIRYEAQEDEGVLRRVAIPLLEQMTVFARQNLLLFVGQQPNAYFILPANNPLTPLVKPKGFPLFEHLAGELESEFANLVNAASFNLLAPDSEALDFLFRETAGHPYLTVALLQELFDWLIVREVRVQAFMLNAETLRRFAKEALVKAVMREGGMRRKERFHFFAGTIAGCLHDDTKKRDKWSYVVHRLMRAIAADGEEDFGCSRKRYLLLAEQVRHDVEFDPAEMLTQCMLSNFLTAEGERVRVTIPILGRIARIATPQVA